MITTDEPAIVSEASLDAVVVEDGQSNRSFPNSPWANESDWSEVFRKIGDLFDQLVASETGSWRWRRGFAGYARYKYEIVNPLVIEVANPVRSWVTVSFETAVNRILAALTDRFLPLDPSWLTTMARWMSEIIVWVSVTMVWVSVTVAWVVVTLW